MFSFKSNSSDPKTFTDVINVKKENLKRCLDHGLFCVSWRDVMAPPLLWLRLRFHLFFSFPFLSFFSVKGSVWRLSPTLMSFLRSVSASSLVACSSRCGISSSPLRFYALGVSANDRTVLQVAQHHQPIPDEFLQVANPRRHHRLYMFPWQQARHLLAVDNVSWTVT